MRLRPTSLRKRNGSPADARQLERRGRFLEAIDVLRAANRQQPNGETEVRLVELRHRAFPQLTESRAPASPVRATQGTLSLDEQGIPTIEPSELSGGTLNEAIQGHGCLLIRGLIDEQRVSGLVASIDHVFEARDAHLNGSPLSETAPWFAPFEPNPELAFALGIGRKFVNKGSGTWIADSPRALFQLIEMFEEAGLRRPITEYLGERPALSVNKGTLRRVAPTGGTEWWHQDGAFLGEGIRSLNIWLSLSHCGRDAPGLDLVPRRIDHIVEAGTEDADFDWSVASEVVERESGGRIVRPIFQPGDALLFDHFFLHRTGTDPGMSQTRYATETWFFAPSAYPDPAKQVPLVF
jgi:hypothetical protein